VDVHADVAQQWRVLAVLARRAGWGAIQNLPKLGLAGVEHDPNVLETVDLQEPLYSIRLLLDVQDSISQGAVLLRELVQAVMPVNLGSSKVFAAVATCLPRTLWYLALGQSQFQGGDIELYEPPYVTDCRVRMYEPP
jgi:hypothetical protein